MRIVLKEERTTNKRISAVLMGFILYPIIYALKNTENAMISLPHQLYIAVLIIILLMIYFKSIKIFDKHENRYFQTCLVIWFLYFLGIYFRNGILTKNMTISPYIMLPYIVPLFALLPKTVGTIQQIFKTLSNGGVIFIALTPFWFDRVEVVIGIAAACGFLLLNWIYLSKMQKRISQIVVVLALILSLYLGRRGSVLSMILFLIFGYLISHGLFIKKYVITKMYIFVTLILFICVGVYVIKHISVFDNFKERLTEDTRTYVFECYKASMRGNYIFGKGMNGTYYCPLFNEEGYDVDVSERTTVECGYLQIILKGGLVNMTIYFLMLIPAIYLGYFKSNNHFSKACAILILLWLVDMFPFGLPVFGIKYANVWIAVGFCYSGKIRCIEDTVLIKALKTA